MFYNVAHLARQWHVLARFKIGLKLNGDKGWHVGTSGGE